MSAIDRSFLAAGVAAAFVGITSPAHAALQLAFDINGITFACVDNDPTCDTNPAIGVLQLANDTFAGVQVNGSIQVSTGTPATPGQDLLSTSSLSITNTNGVPITGSAAISDTSFSAPSLSWATSGSGVFVNAIGATTTLNWFVDPANDQGADSSTDTPGMLVDTFSHTATSLADSFSNDGAGLASLTAPFSLTEQFTLSLPAKAELLNRGQAIILTAVPEPSTWAMLALGFAGIGFVGVMRRRKTSRHAF